MKRVLVFFWCLVLLVTTQVQSGDSIMTQAPPDSCHASDVMFKIPSYTTRLAILNTQLLPIDLENPIADARLRIAHGDYRLLFFGDIGYGLNEIVDDMDLCKLETRFIEGSGHSIESKEWAILSSKFSGYVKKYNKEILNFYRLNIIEPPKDKNTTNW